MRSFVLSFFFLWSLNTFAQLDFQKLADSTYLFTTYHEYKGSKVSSNGVLRLTTNGVVMIDTPWDTTQFQPLLDSIRTKFHSSVALVIATHWHEDRSGGLEFYTRQGIPTYSTRATYNLCRENKMPLAKYTFIGDTTFRIGNTIVETYYPGSGHTSDNIVVYFPDDRILAGGCFLKSVDATDLGNLSDANLGLWPVAVRNLIKKYRKVKIAVPGHDRVDGKKALKHTLRLLKR